MSPSVALSGSAATYKYAKGAPAGQLIAGIAVPFAVVPRRDATLDYRRIEVAGSGLRPITASAGTLRQPLTLRNGSLTDQSLMLGIRYSFGDC